VPDQDASLPPCRALVPLRAVEAAQPEPRLRVTGSDAAFVAQLLAARHRAPIARDRRRATPADALAAYQAAAALAGRNGVAGLTL
jgi:hypothetical protein